MLIRLLRSYLRPHRRLLLAVAGFQLASTISTLYLPALNADIIDHGVAHGDTGAIVRAGTWMLLFAAAQIVCSGTAVYFGAKAAMRLGRELRGALFAQVGTFSSREVAQFGAPSLITRVTNDVQQVQMLVIIGCTTLVGAPTMCLGGVIMALRTDPGLSWLMVVAVPVMVVIIGAMLRRMVPLFRVMQGRIDVVNRTLREQLTGVRVVRAFVREPFETARFGEANDNLTATALALGRLQARIFPVVMLVFGVSSLAVLWFGSARVEAGTIHIGQLTAFLAYLMQILMSVMMATFMVMMVPRAAVSAERISAVLDTESSVRPAPHPVAATGEAGAAEPGVPTVQLREVQFRYPGAESAVLRNVSLRAVAGTTTAIVGGTGSGKSTLLSLIARLFDVTGGALLVGGVDVRELDLDSLWAGIGIVPQRPYLFSGTVASNLRYGNPQAGDEELWRCLDVAQARDFVAAMPQGLETPISQGGTNVSGGQRQRLAIARALVHRPGIYLFDDAFSALDLATDARLRAALRPVTEHAVVIIVAQRVSTILDADQIIVLEDGAVVGAGTHEELFDSCPTYREIVESQQTLGVPA